MSGRAITNTATVQAWAPIPASNQTVLQRCIDGASELIENWCGRRFRTASYQAWHSGGNARSAYASLWLADPSTALATPNVTAVAGISEDGTTLSVVIVGTAVTAGTQAMVIARTGELLRGSVSSGLFSRTPWSMGDANVYISYTAGFTSAADTTTYTMPLDVEQACVELTWLLYRESQRVGLDNIQTGGRSAGLRGRISPQAEDAIMQWAIQIPRHTLVG